jgi:hypothetical protein
MEEGKVCSGKGIMVGALAVELVCVALHYRY